MGKPRKRMPSKPLLGMPVVVGMSDAVMAMSNTFSCAEAGDGEKAEAASSRATDTRFFMAWAPDLSGGMQEMGRRLGHELLEPCEVIAGMRLVVDARRAQVDVRHHGPKSLAQRARRLHGIEGPAQIVANPAFEIGIEQSGIL